ncbi:MAG TPA: AMP-binding protein [Hyphomicrobiaceae bacterium]|nr:AMP-binding protein [Hyphomicrobiaceae bacterium]
MSEVQDGWTIPALFAAAVAKHAGNAFFAVPPNPARGYLPAGYEISYGEAAAQVAALTVAYTEAGYGLGHRVATLLENRPEHVLHRIALNAIGACVVPINPDYRAGETAYLIEHSQPDLVLALTGRETQIGEALAQSAHKPPVAFVSQTGLATPLGGPARAAEAGAPQPTTPASVLYTSGTTGRPKGCILSHGYEVASGAWYASIGGIATFRTGQERIYNPLPLYHVNAGTVSLFGAVWTGNCQVQPDRFHPQHWWAEIAESRATVAHYLGIIAPLLLKQPPSDADRRHALRFGIGAGIEPQLHAAFEQRFGFPMIELWGMTEMVRVLADSVEPRQVGTRAFGRAVPGIEVRVVDDADADVPDGQPGEMIIRHSAATPRRGFFSGYLADSAATEAAWRGGWFHTGDTVTRSAGGLLHFVDRKKNIIRRSGENIAAAEIEAMLLTHPDVRQAAVMAVKDELRDEEVLACVVLKRPLPAAEAAQALFRHCYERLAYYKAPGWMHFLDSLPTTGTQKIQKHTIYPGGVDPRSAPGMIDLRTHKRRPHG